MQINSVWHLTHSSRTLRINKSGNDKTAAIVFTQFLEHGIIKESTRIALESTAKKLKLRKFLILGEDSTVCAGPFDISTREVDESGERCNILINDKFYFLTFIPDQFYAVPDDVTLLIPADLDIKKTQIKALTTLSKQAKVKRAVFSGEFADSWCKKLKNVKCEVIDNVRQQGLFS